MSSPNLRPIHDQQAIRETFVRIPEGRFLMGGGGDDKFVSAVELPQRNVNVGAFLLARVPVTEGDWAKFPGSHAPDHFTSSRLPLVRVGWHEANEYTAWLSETLEMSCRLPTEAEWEYACRAGTRSIFPCGEDISPELANYLYDESGLRIGAGQRAPVACYPPNAFGLHDMIGNICEWTADAWVPGHDRSGADGTPDPDKRTIRGGAWDHLPRLLRSSWRDWAPARAQYDNLGFRVAADLPAQ
jgi:formylglycine-generating enzyme required for sulfatase activity